MLYILGNVQIETFPFSISGVQEEGEASIVSKGVLGRSPPKEFTAPADEDLTLTGEILPHKIGGMDELDELRAMRDRGERFRVERGDGVGLGWYAIRSISKAHSDIMAGGVGFRVAHTIKLTSTDRSREDGQNTLQKLLSLFG
ncbi:phage tail protein [Roseibium sediminis]|uniref:phage tail protein n=1 Tax=Roseibium sediminis TaxID=1775174 RepID=UPI00123CFDFB|nr:phage tail protein [Roseibium sediminis]